MTYNMIHKNAIVWIDGKIIPQDQAKVLFLTHALHYGSAVFEGIRVYNRFILQLKEHIDRLFNSCQIMDLNITYSKQEIIDACELLVKTHNIQHGYLRPLVWRGDSHIKICVPDSNIEAAIAYWEVSSSIDSLDSFLGRKKITLTLSKWKRPSPEASPFNAKASGLYIIPTLASNEAAKAGFNDALMLDYRDYIAEATAANIFIVIDGILHTPIADSFLNGITRQTIIKLAKQNDIDVIERHIPFDDLEKTTEVFLTGTTAEIQPVSSIDKIKFTESKVTNKIMEIFFNFVTSNK